MATAAGQGSVPRVAYISFGAPPPASVTVAGKLTLPPTRLAAGRGPAVVICHGSDGIDGRGEFHAGALQQAGIATLEIDMWAARGTLRGPSARPRSPIDTLADAFGALAFLGAQPEIDPARIGVMGFSWGGAVTLLASVARHAQAFAAGKPPFAAHAALYPVCWAYARIPAMSLAGRTAAPILLQTGDADAYDSPDAGEDLAAALGADGGGAVACIVHRGATHGFDRDLPSQVIEDPFAHGGVGGPVAMTFNRDAAAEARAAVRRFFDHALGAELEGSSAVAD